MTETEILTKKIHLTSSAIGEVKRLIEENKIDTSNRLRVGVVGGGCSGMSYKLSFDEPKESDERVRIEDLEILVDKKHLLYLEGITLDFQDGLQGRGFSFNNPNAKKTCGCGTSFSA